VVRDFLVWLQTDLGRGADGAQSWSEALLGTANFWGLLEGTHLLSLMLFFGTILIVDLRLLGAVFRNTPVSEVSAKVLPLTVVGFLILVSTGLALFFAKPLVYYHNIWFRAKLVFLGLALLNVVVFHYSVQRGIAGWDALPKPPARVRTAAVLSLAAWLCVIFLGRFIAYEWLECGKPIPHWVNVAQDCASSEYGARDVASLVQ